MITNEIKNLKDRYQNGRDNIGRDFVLPCLKEAKLYRRGTGFFSSSVLKSYVEILDKVINGELKIEILCSPVVQDKTLIDSLKKNTSEKDREETIRRLSDQIVLVAAGFAMSPEKVGYRSKLLSYLIATGKLEIKFAIPKDFDLLLQEGVEEEQERNLYHVKVGYFQFSEDEYVAFDGSFNESESGLMRHVDRTQVYKSWLPEDQRRVLGIREDIDNDWEGHNTYIKVYPVSKEAIDKIISLSPSTRPTRQNKPKHHHIDKTRPSKPEILERLWDHQKKAVEVFLEKKNGILQMATGTGKTTTSLEIARQLYLSGEVASFIIITYGTDLLTQWEEAVNEWIMSDRGLFGISVLKSFDSTQEIRAFISFPKNKFLILGRRSNLIEMALSANNVKEARPLIIYDEVHGFGSESNLKLDGIHKEFTYKLGLSATPDREYDEVGTSFIKNEIGEIIFDYSIENAINDGVLCEFDYVVIYYPFLQEDRDRLKAVYSRKAASEAEGHPWSEDRLYQELARVTKKAIAKPSALQEYLEKNPDHIKNSIIYTLDKEQGRDISGVVANFTNKYKTYFEGTDSSYLNDLEAGEIDCVIANERLNEGIDIPSLKTIIFVSNDRVKLKTIQRLGRCLRRDPNNPKKKALVIDLIREDGDEMSADLERMEWLEGLSRTRRKREA